MKVREQRRAVHIAARMQCGTEWTDICIKNMSSRGLMAQAERPPPPRAYVEIRRGTQRVIGRTVWSANGSFGICSQDRIDIDAIVGEPRLDRRPASPGAALPERRRDRVRVATPQERADRSRRLASAVQFAVLVAAGGSAAAFAAFQVYEVLTGALRPVATQLVL